MSYECEETMLRFEPGPYQIKETAVHNIRPLYYALYNLIMLTIRWIKF